VSNPLSQLLASMQQKTVTLGWDVVVAYNAASLNDLFAAQYVTNVRTGNNLPPINATLNMSSGLSVQLVDVVLGPPLISFTPGSSQQANITMNFVGGELLVTETSGRTHYVSGYQTILPGDNYQLTMIVPLEQVAGEDNKNCVYVDLSNASGYTANLLSGTTAASYLGQYFQSIFKKETGSTIEYELGTMVTGTSENLTPVSFEIRTQVYPGTSGPDGAVLLLVATTYNPKGGDIPGEEFPYLIPDGQTCGLVVRSATLFGNIIAPYYTKTLVGSPSFSVDYYAGSAPAAYLRCDGGSIDAGTFSSNWDTSAHQHSIWSGTHSGAQKNYESMNVPYSGWTLEPVNNLLTMTWDSGFNQEFGASMSYPRSEGIWTESNVNLTISASFNVTASAANQQVCFSGGSGTPNVSVSFKSSGWLSKYFGDGGIRDRAASQMAGQVKPVVKQVMKVQTPQVNAFAVSHLLFPSQNVLNYSEAYIPGDLAAFGQIQPSETAFTLSPLQAVVGAGQTQQFTTVKGSGTTTWGLGAAIGSISQNGLYVAPPVVPKAMLPVIVTAKEGSNEAAAIVMVVPYGVTIAPAYAMVFNNNDPVAFQATVLGQGGTPVWSLSPDDGSVGTLSSNGVYTAPATFPTTVQMATVTVTAGTASASAVVCLADVTLGLTLSPTYAVLGPAATQAFSVAGSPPTWTLEPALGTITADGQYRAPASIPQPATVLVIASLDNEFYGVAPIILQPAFAMLEENELQ
jgi:hypothetical protein